MNVEHRADEKSFDVHLHRCQRQSSKCILLLIQKHRDGERGAVISPAAKRN